MSVFIKSDNSQNNKDLIYLRFIGKNLNKTKIQNPYFFIEDIYYHSLSYQEDQITVSINTIEKITKYISKYSITLKSKSDEDVMYSVLKYTLTIILIK